MVKYEQGQQLMFEDMIVSIHSSTDNRSMIRIQGLKPEVMSRLKRHPDFYVDIGNNAYLRVDSNQLHPCGIVNNRQAVYLLEEE